MKLQIAVAIRDSVVEFRRYPALLLCGASMGLSLAPVLLFASFLEAGLLGHRPDVYHIVEHSASAAEPRLYVPRGYLPIARSTLGPRGVEAYESSMQPVAWQSGDRARSAFSLKVTPALMAALGHAPVEGRGLTAADARPTPEVALVRDGVRRARFGGGVVGRVISVNGRPTTIVGVFPDAFRLPTTALEPELLLPLDVSPAAAVDYGRSGIGLLIVAPDVPARELAERVAAAGDFGRSVALRLPPDADLRLSLMPFNRAFLRGDTLSALWLLVLLSLGVFLLSVTSLWSVQLITAGRAAHTDWIRNVLGEGRTLRVYRLLTRILLLAGTAVVVGLGGLALGLSEVARSIQLSLGLAVPPALTFTVAVLAVTLVVGGCLAASVGLPWRLWGSRQARPGTGPPVGLIVAGNLAACGILLTCTTVAFQHLWAFIRTDVGIDVQHVQVGVLSGTAKTQPSEFWAALESIASTESVQAAAMVDLVPFATRASRPVVADSGRRFTSVDVRRVSSSYFDTLSIEVVALDPAAYSGKERALVVVSERFADSAWKGSPIGRQLTVMDTPYSVAGVVRDTREEGLRMDVRPAVYLLQETGTDIGGSPYVLIRGRSAPDAVLAMNAPSVQRSSVAVDDLGPLSSYLQRDLMLLKAYARAAVMLLAIALAVGVFGGYTALSQFAGARQRAWGIRKALGASHGRLTMELAWHFAAPLGCGFLAAFVCGIPAARLLSQSFLGDGSVGDAAIGAAIAGTLMGGILAMVIPFRTLMKVDPLAILRED
jgi:putative ABC transport system permease protein